MFINNQQQEKTDSDMFTVDGQEYYVLFSETVDPKRKGEVIRRIKKNIKFQSLGHPSWVEECYVFITSNKEVFKKRQKIKRNLESTKVKPNFELKLAGENWLFYVRSNQNLKGQNLHTLITEIERVLYETRNNFHSAEYIAEKIMQCDRARVKREGGHLVAYIIFEDDEVK